MEPDGRVIVFGGGAVGGYLAARLAMANPPVAVTLMGRESTVSAIQAHGLRLLERGVTHITRMEAASGGRHVAPADLLILAVKTYDVTASIPEVGRLMTPDGVVVALQNGVGTEEFVATAVGREHTVAGTLTVAVRADEPGTVTRASSGGGLAVAPLAGAVSPHVLAVLQRTGLPVQVVRDYRSLRWSKLLLNMLGAASSAILDMDLARVVADSRLFALERQAFAEGVRIMRTEGIGFASLPGYPVRLAALAMRLPAPLARLTVGRRLARSRGGQSPMLRADLQRGRTEVRWLNGAIAAAAERVNRPAPVNAALAGLIEELAEHPDRRDNLRGDPDALLAYLRERGLEL